MGETRKPTYKNGGQGLPGFSGGCKSIGEDSVVAGVPGVSVGCVAWDLIRTGRKGESFPEVWCLCCRNAVFSRHFLLLTRLFQSFCRFCSFKVIEIFNIIQLRNDDKLIKHLSINLYPYNPCKVYLPTLGWFLWYLYTVHGCYGTYLYIYIYRIHVFSPHWSIVMGHWSPVLHFNLKQVPLLQVRHGRGPTWNLIYIQNSHTWKEIP